MKKLMLFTIVILVFGACSTHMNLHSFKKIEFSKEISSNHTWDSLYFDCDSNIIVIPKKNKFQFYFDITDDNKLIFSTNSKDTVGSLIANKNSISFQPFLKDTIYEFLNFKKPIGHKWNIQYCGLFYDHSLTILNKEEINNEVILTIGVEKNPNYPTPSHYTKIDNLIISLKYGLKSMEISPDWSIEKVQINAP